jgi:hypothetical protein
LNLGFGGNSEAEPDAGRLGHGRAYTTPFSMAHGSQRSNAEPPPQCPDRHPCAGDSIGGVINVVIAHGSGIDDVLWFLIPVVLAMLVLRRAEKRAAKPPADTDPVESPSPSPPDR